MTYVDLLSALMSWLRHPDSEQQFPTFVALAEARINRRLSEAGVTGAVRRYRGSVGAEYVGAPDDLAIPVTLVLTSSGEGVTNTTLETLNRLRETENAGEGRPRYFAITGGEMRFYPVPNASYEAELVYQSGVPALGSTVSTNWLLASYPDAYLYGALIEGGLYAGDEPRVAAWKELFDTALAEITATERAKRGSCQAALRTDMPPTRPICSLTSSV